MKKKILAVILGLTLCFGMTGCTPTPDGGRKNYDETSKHGLMNGKVKDFIIFLLSCMKRN